jgi:hypothetical protein
MDNSANIKRAFDEKLPMVMRDAAVGIGSFLTFDCLAGAACDQDVHVWVFLCDWRIESDGEIVATSEMDLSEFATTIASRFSNLKLISICETKPGYLDLFFSEGVKLTLEQNLQEYSADDDLLRIYIGPDVIGYTGRTRFYLHPSASCNAT